MQMKRLTKIYGHIPRRPEHLTVHTLGIERLDDGSEIRNLIFRLHYGERKIEFPVCQAVPKKCDNARCAVIISGGSDSPANFCEQANFTRLYISVSDFYCDGGTTKVGRALLYGKRQVGVISLLAFAALRTAEYARSPASDCKISLCASGEFCEAALIAAYIGECFCEVILKSPQPASDYHYSKTADFPCEKAREKMLAELTAAASERCEVIIN